MRAKSQWKAYRSPSKSTTSPNVQPSTSSPSTTAPTVKPSTSSPSTRAPTVKPSTSRPSTRAPTVKPSTSRPSTRAPTIKPSTSRPSTRAPTSGILVTSDGTQARPYCSWYNVCQYDSSIEILCAEKLCEASGLAYDPSTVFVSSSGNMCEPGNNIYDDYAWHYVVDLGYYSYYWLTLESAITARCV